MEPNIDKIPYRWQLPNSENKPANELSILNSFTKKKDLFVTNDRKVIKWYSCGPTVYDVSHLGHARCYITFDIIRRILTDYFGYQVFYCINITDIDDKIIKRARSHHLCNQYINKCLAKEIEDNKLKLDIKEAIVNYEKRREDEKDNDKRKMINDIIKKSNDCLEELNLMQESSKTCRPIQEVLNDLKDVIADEQDFKLADTITDHQIFKALTIRYEQEFHEDMQKLGVLPPNVLTRVSEYIEEVGLYLKKLEANGFAYRAQDGSVYFDTNKFHADPKHSYAKLVPEAYLSSNKKSLDDGEGELSASVQENTKRSPNDFALWKKSKVGEPSWTTQDYEAGRPGWHIECSVMASDILGENFDIHSGGCDLKFPHHDNEIAQAEAYYNTGKNWVNYFLHSGHLTIGGCKMSKSLKNFTTIKEALEKYSSRQLRFAFLAHGWADTLDYSENTMNTALVHEKTLREFFQNTMAYLRHQQSKLIKSSGDTTPKLCDHFQKWTQADKELNQEFINTVVKIDAALCDNFDTRTALHTVNSLVKEYNKKPNINPTLIKDIACYIAKILTIFGANFDEFKLEGILANESTSREKAIDNTQAVFKYVETLAHFRSDVRRISKDGLNQDPQQKLKELLALCDNLRDITLPALGVRLEDREVDGRSFDVKLIDAATLAKEKALAEKKEFEKKSKEDKLKLERQQREEKMKMPPSQMFTLQIDKYSKFDENGLPTHDINGKEISKSSLKKLQRLYEEQKKRYESYLEKTKE